MHASKTIGKMRHRQALITRQYSTAAHSASISISFLCALT
ncbi:hypothetical protein BN439_3782 [Erwinia amylovora Ea644]|nr:hypothetical protein BN439_3782 [Erwinia amylovora Ea644]CCP08876.1 hypothetical protein BN440_3891 [Erwinia amylovora MR1]